MNDLYYVLMAHNLGNVKQCKTLIKHGQIQVNHQVVRDVRYKVKSNDIIHYQNRLVPSQPFVYYMMNKPAGYICANKDQNKPCVVDLIDRQDCYCLGRLDQDTTGLLILTNDKSLSKKLLLPQHHIEKVYYVSLLKSLHNKLVDDFSKGIIIDKTVQCAPAQLEIIDSHHCFVTIHEGKYHQIKKMFLSCGNQVKRLKRVQFGQIQLDEKLELGEFRFLTDEEISKLKK